MKRTVKILLISFFSLIVVTMFSKVNAASASISASKTSATVGDSVSINVNFTAAAWTLTVSGDGVSTTKYADVTSDAENASQSKSISLNTSSAGTKVIKLTGDVSDGTTGETIKINTSVTVTVNPKPEPTPAPTPAPDPAPSNGGGTSSGNSSSSATITKLVIGDSTYKNPAKDISISVDNSVSSVNITPTISNGESYTINGGKSNNVKLETGTNRVTIKLASGASYIVRISRLPKEEVIKPNVIDETVDPIEEEEIVKLALEKLEIEGYELEPIFAADVFTYKLVKEIPADIEELVINAVANKENAEIEITGNKELVEGENIISIIVKVEGEEPISYQIIVNKEAKKVEQVVAMVDVKPIIEVPQPRWNNTQKLLISLFTSIIAAMGIAYAVIEYRYTNENNDVFAPAQGDFANILNEDESFENLNGIINKPVEESNTQEVAQDSQVEETVEKVSRTKSKGKHF